MKNELLSRLSELQNLAKEAMEVQVKNPKMSHKYYMSTIMEMDIRARDKVILMDMYLNDGTVKGTEAMIRTCMTRQLYNNGTRLLANEGYIVVNSKGYYSINMNIY